MITTSKKRFKYYIINCKGDNSEDLKDINKIFKTFITDIRSKLNLEELKQPFIIYFITFRDFIFNKAISISIKLANKAFSYLLTVVDIIEITITTLSTNFFLYIVLTLNYNTP